MDIDKTVSENPEKDLLIPADELFNQIFKITYYDDHEHAICNKPLTELSHENPPQPHADILALVA